jgi:hypothetical protein
VQSDVCEHDAHQPNARVVVSLRDDLGSDQDVEATGLHVSEHLLREAAGAGRVPVQTGDSGLGKVDAHLFLDALGSDAQQRGVGCTALGTAVGRCGRVVAVVAAKALAVCVVDQGDVAVGTVFGGAAIEAHDLGRESPPVQKQDRLAPVGQGAGHGASQGRGQDHPVASRRALALACQVDQRHRGQRAAADPVGQHQSPDLAPIGSETGLQ